MRSERGDFNSCEKWSSSVLPAVVVVGVVSLLLLRLPMAIRTVAREQLNAAIKKWSILF